MKSNVCVSAYGRVCVCVFVYDGWLSLYCRHNSSPTNTCNTACRVHISQTHELLNQLTIIIRFILFFVSFHFSAISIQFICSFIGSVIIRSHASISPYDECITSAVELILCYAGRMNICKQAIAPPSIDIHPHATSNGNQLQRVIAIEIRSEQKKKKWINDIVPHRTHRLLLTLLIDSFNNFCFSSFVCAQIAYRRRKYNERQRHLIGNDEMAHQQI